jgi:LDH2 family malate/lactate/ureidoglycolate dehydrogenase
LTAKYPIGEHKGFGLALLCELLTGVLSGGQILDEDEHEKGMGARSTSHFFNFLQYFDKNFSFLIYTIKKETDYESGIALF